MEIPRIPVTMSSNKKYSALEILQFTVLTSIVLYFGRTLFIPLSFAMLISFILYPLCKGMEKKGINKGISILVLMLLVAIMFGVIIYLLLTQLMQFSHEWQTLKLKLLETKTQLSVFLVERIGVSLERQLEFIENFIGNLGSQIIPFLQNTAYSFSESIFLLILILIFSSLILFHRRLLSNVIYQLFPTGNKMAIHEILIETIHAYYNFIKGMMLVYLIVGILNSIGLAIIGIPHPVLFGFIASILTFIPYVGIMIAALLPITFAWIAFDSIWYPVAVIFVFAIVQLAEAYIIFPFAVGGRLKINSLVLIVTIVAGGILWGAAGMILFIPFVSIIKLIADRTESLKTISMILGDGKNNK
ncbi:MAG: AI-2E family transporter [Bacteroidetes bacterium]|nr:AI-2E family transporter [Bacteroidota bacterium]